MAMYGKDQFHKATSEGVEEAIYQDIDFRLIRRPEMTEYPGDLMHVKMFPAVDR